MIYKIKSIIKLTLKKRIFFSVIASTLIAFICVASISYYSMSSIMNNKISDNIRVNTNQIKISFDNMIKNMNFISHPLSYQGHVGKLVYENITASDVYKKSETQKQIRKEMNILDFTNPEIGFITYYYNDLKSFQFSAFEIDDQINIFELPLISQYSKIAYYGPHKSIMPHNNQIVLSAIREVDIPDRDDVYVYLETGFEITRDILASTHLVASTHILILNNDSKIVYSENIESFPLETYFEYGDTKENKGDVFSGKTKQYYWFESYSNQGWSIVSVISKVDYNKERNNWMVKIIVSLILMLGFSGVISLGLWRVIYMPIKKFQEEIKLVSENNLSKKINYINIAEYDEILEQFQHMKEQIKKLILEIGEEERIKSKLEIDKMRNQINPHFLMNTLNTVHWMAMINGQNEIDGIVQALNKLLSYNLGRDSKRASLISEIQAINDYLSIQKVRYDINYKINMNVDEKLKHTYIPRFLLQPIVENSLFHGLEESGNIYIDISSTDKLIICIRDDGVGMFPDVLEDIQKNKSSKKRKSGMGIGLDYVRITLKAFYGEKAEFEIISKKGEGTSTYIRIPIYDLRGESDEGIDS